MKRNVFVFFVLFVSMNLCGLGVSLFVQSNLGGDTLTVIQEGISRTFAVSLGSASRIFNLVFFVIALFIARKHIGWVTIVNGLFVGSFIDLYGTLLASIDLRSVFLLRLIAVLLGQLSLVISFSLLIQVRSGMNLVDAVSYGLEKIIPLSFKTIRTLFDVFFVAVGWIMGGAVGIGSVFTMLTTGVGIDHCTQWMKKYIKFEKVIE